MYLVPQHEHHVLAANNSSNFTCICFEIVCLLEFVFVLLQEYLYLCKFLNHVLDSGGICSVQDRITLIVLLEEGEAVALMMTNNGEITSGGIKPHNR